MGLFDFVKDAGKVLDDSMDVAKNLKAELSEQGLEVERLEIQAKDGVVTIGGKVKSQSDREKVILALGNVKGIGSVNDQLEVTAAEAESVFYTVKSGDTLSKISKTHYGNAMKYMKIFEANQPLLKNPDKIYPGQVLRIPPLTDK